MVDAKAINDILDKFAKDIHSHIKELKETCSDTNGKITAIEKIVVELKKQNLEMQVKVETLESKVEFLERQFKKNNIIYFGISETKEESLPILEQKTIAIISEMQKVHIKPDDIANLYRIGKDNNGRHPRPVFIALASFKKKMEILSNRSKLKGTDIFVNDDLTPKQREVRKNLQIHARRLREEGKRVSIRGDKVIVHSDSYDVNELNSSFQELVAVDEELGLTPVGSNDCLRRDVLERTLRPRPTAANRATPSKN